MRLYFRALFIRNQGNRSPGKMLAMAVWSTTLPESQWQTGPHPNVKMKSTLKQWNPPAPKTWKIPVHVGTQPWQLKDLCAVTRTVQEAEGGTQGAWGALALGSPDHQLGELSDPLLGLNLGGGLQEPARWPPGGRGEVQRCCPGVSDSLHSWKWTAEAHFRSGSLHWEGPALLCWGHSSHAAGGGGGGADREGPREWSRGAEEGHFTQ